MGTTFFYYIVLVLLLMGIAKTVVSIILSANESRMQSKRNDQLDTQSKKKVKESSDEQLKQVINKVTTPIVDTMFANKDPKNLKKLERKLKAAGWDNYLNPLQWKALSLVLAILGIFLFLVFSTQSKIFASIFILVFIIGPNFLLNNSYKTRIENLLISFPETVRIISGYLSAGLLLSEAFSETAKDASSEWKALLEEFTAKCEATDILTALDWFKSEVDIVEAKEFFATVRLSLELGGSAKTGFAEQADRIQQLLKDSMQRRIEKRKMWATIVQAPVMLCVMAAFALPLFGTFTDLF